MDAGFPLTEHGGVLVFVGLDLPLVLHLSQSGGLLLLHFGGQHFSLPVVLVGHLLQDAHLVALACSCFLGGSGLEFGILLGDRGFNFSLFFRPEPLELLLLGLLEQDVLFSGLVDILEQVDSGLLLSLPLGLPHFVLSLGLLLHELIDELLVGILVTLSLLVVLLQLDDFLSPLQLLGLLNLSKRFLTSDGCSKELLISLFTLLRFDVSKFFFGGIMINKLEIPLSIKKELLSLSFFVHGLFFNPLGLEHILFSQLLF